MAYQGYGGGQQVVAPAGGPGPAPQGYGQQGYPAAAAYADPEKHKLNGGDDEVRCCKEGSSLAKVDNWCVFLCMMGGMLCLIATVTPSWRNDPIGTTEIEETWYYPGFDSRSYGILHVKGSWSQAWTTLAQSACDVRNIGQMAGIGEYAVNLVKGVFTGGESGGCETSGVKMGTCCSKSTECQQGFASHMHLRCTEYQTMMRISMVTLSATFLSFILIIAGTLVTSMSKRRASGGIAFGLYLFAGVLLMIGNIVWVVTSDSSFKKLGASAWYPYPSLGASFYIHTVGYLLILICDGIFGYIVLPSVWDFDPVQEKLDKKKAKLEKRQQREQQYAQKKEELKAIMNGQGQQQQQPQNFPAPPGYGQQPAPQAYQPQPYGQAYQQPTPQPLGFSQPAPLGFQSDPSAVGYGQGGAQPAAPAGDFGLGAGGGYGAPAPGVNGSDFGVAAPAGCGAPADGGYGAPAGGYGAPAPAGGYGAPAAGGGYGDAAGGYGQAAPAGGYGAPPAGGYGAPQAAPKYNWPAANKEDEWNSMPAPHR